ncbi:metalloregulator ArsR/SmtB family transcription factor [Bacillus sp. FJAT-49736]|uniref:ArsR/SmtB family transcription factor n=1 Tax=Bacillus sp. FJAT-49736 TaxID=2833582 RepID=UPI001BC8FAEE|nr:metalloregulator ArsR/SmtB family transcription factor [Bacillus sp. FJAT-49736]MBS4174906.1 winged helix-turn-helix transcriptional regulator [Bacillus sp. FJAT-49736]
MTDIYRALADPHRRRILQMLSQHERTQSDLVAAFPISQPAIKKHIAILKEEELIEERRQGKFVFYRLNEKVYQYHFEKLKHEMELVLDDKLGRLKNYLEKGE